MSLYFYGDRNWLTLLIKDVFCCELWRVWKILLMELDFIDAVEDEGLLSGQVDELVVSAF